MGTEETKQTKGFDVERVHQGKLFHSLCCLISQFTTNSSIILGQRAKRRSRYACKNTPLSIVAPNEVHRLHTFRILAWLAVRTQHFFKVIAPINNTALMCGPLFPKVHFEPDPRRNNNLVSFPPLPDPPTNSSIILGRRNMSVVQGMLEKTPPLPSHCVDQEVDSTTPHFSPKGTL